LNLVFLRFYIFLQMFLLQFEVMTSF